MLYVAGMDVANLALGTVTLGTAGKSDVVINLSSVVGVTSDIAVTSSKFFLLPLGSALSYYPQNTPGSVAETMTDWSKVPFARELRSRIRTAMTSASWTSPSGFDITYSHSANLFTWSYPSANFTITFSASAGARLFGYGAPKSGATSYLADYTPYYVIAPSLARVSDATPNYEPGGIGSHVVPDAGYHVGYGVSRLYSPLYREWVQQFETREKSERLAAVTAHPYTFQQLFEDCRGHMPFLVYDGWAAPPVINGATCTSEVFAFTNEGLAWAAKNSRATSNNNLQFNHRFMTRVIAGVGVTA